MNELVTVVTMSSLELVDFVNAERNPGEATLAHADFLKKVPLVLGKEGAGKFSCTYRDVQNKERPAYRFPKREACLMAMSYSYDLQAKVFDRMTALEQQLNAPAVPQTLPEALRLAADQIEKRLAAEALIKLQAPKVEFAEAIRNTDDSVDMLKMAKTLGWGRNKLMKAMRDDSILMANNVPYQKYIDRGYFTVIEGALERSSGKVTPIFSTQITGAGQVFLQRKYARPGQIAHRQSRDGAVANC